MMTSSRSRTATILGPVPQFVKEENALPVKPDTEARRRSPRVEMPLSLCLLDFGVLEGEAVHFEELTES